MLLQFFLFLQIDDEKIYFSSVSIRNHMFNRIRETRAIVSSSCDSSRVDRGEIVRQCFCLIKCLFRLSRRRRNGGEKKFTNGWKMCWSFAFFFVHIIRWLRNCIFFVSRTRYTNHDGEKETLCGNYKVLFYF